MAAARTFGSYSFTCAPHRLDRTALENERAQQERVRRYGQQEPPAMAQYRAMEPDETVAQLQDLEHEIWALGREKRRMDSAEFVKRLAQSSMAHKARVAGRSRRHARNREASARFDEGEEDKARDALLLEEELEKLDDGLWDPKVKQRAARRSSDQYQVERKRWHQQRLEHQMIRDERSDPAFRRPRPAAWADNRPQAHQPSRSAHRAREPAGSTVHGTFGTLSHSLSPSPSPSPSHSLTQLGMGQIAGVPESREAAALVWRAAVHTGWAQSPARRQSSYHCVTRSRSSRCARTRCCRSCRRGKSWRVSWSGS